MRLFKSIIFCILAWVTCGNINAQYSGLDLLDGKKKKVVHFDYINGFTIVKVVYGGIFYMDFLLDTGASHNILFKKTANDILGISYTDTIIIDDCISLTKCADYARGYEYDTPRYYRFGERLP